MEYTIMINGVWYICRNIFCNVKISKDKIMQDFSFFLSDLLLN